MSLPGGESHAISDGARALLLLLFGAATVGVIHLAADMPFGRPDLLLFAASLGAIVTSLAWVLVLALARSTVWAVVMGVGVWVPYLNFVLATVYVRRYWSQGGREPALLGLAGFLGQTIASIRLLLPDLLPLV